MSNRTQIPPKVADNLMVMNRRICCICNEKGKHVQIHHIDGDPNNHDIANLAVLCLECHSRVTGDEGLGHRFTPNEVSLFKKKWEKTCDDFFNKMGGLEEEGNYEEAIISSKTHLEYSYKLNTGDKIAIRSITDKPIGVFIMDSQNYDDWLESDGEEGFDYLKGTETVTECIMEFTVPEDGDYTVLFLNESGVDVYIELDIHIW